MEVFASDGGAGVGGGEGTAMMEERGRVAADTIAVAWLNRGKS